MKENEEDEFTSLTGIARYRDVERNDYILQSWLRNRSTVEFVGLWGNLITPILIPSNWMELKTSLVQTVFRSLQKDELKPANAMGVISKTASMEAQLPTVI